MKKRVLVYPCGTEIGLEIYRSLCYSTHYELIGGADNYDHGRFVYHNLIDRLPFIKEECGEDEILRFEKAICGYNIDFIYPAMDGVIAVFAKYRHLFKETLMIADTETAELCRSKRAAYGRLKDVINVPTVYESIDEIVQYPVFIKPDKGQGAVGARKINYADELKNIDFKEYVVTEYLPGKEYTIDCFTNADGKLVYAKARGRKRIKNGISVNAVFENNSIFAEIALKINKAIRQKGGWFFQLRESADGTLKLLEVAARIAGTSAISRNIGANLPLMTLDIFNNVEIADVALNNCYLELDRALENVFKTNISFSAAYVDYDDTVIQNGVINTMVIKFLYQCVNKKIKLILLSKHEGDLKTELKKYRVFDLFDEVIRIDKDQQKKNYIKTTDSIFIDDSYGERKAIKNTFGIPVFDTHMLECLLED